MLKLKSLIVAEKVIIEKDTNKVTIVDVIENLKSPSYPLFFPNFSCLLYFENDKDNADQNKYKFTLKNNDKLLIDTDVNIDFQGKLTTRSLVNINGLAIPAPGVVTIEISSEGQHIDSYSFNFDQDSKIVS